MNDNLHVKGTLLVAPGGGGAFTPLEPSENGYILALDDTEDLGMKWQEAADMTGPSSSIATSIPRYSDTTGKVLATSNVTISNTDIMTFPAGAGNVLTAGATASERKGTFTFSSGTHAKITTTAAVTGSVIVYTVVSLGTVTTAKAILTTIDNGVGFTPTSADATDTSTINWAIIA